MSDLRTLSPILSLPMVLGALRVALGVWGARRLWDGAMLVLAHRRIGEIGRRVERMLIRMAAGRTMTRISGVRRAVEADALQAVVLKAAPVRIWPSAFGWALKAGHEAAGHGAHLRLILATPDMVALLRASPQARRLLSPVCRMLGIEAETLSPLLPGEVRPERIVVAKEKKKRVRKSRAIEQIGRIPWPRGIFAMVKKHKKWGCF